MALDQVDYKLVDGLDNGAIEVQVYANNSARDSAISSPANGMIIYNTAEAALQQYNGTWSTIAPAPTISSVTGTINEDTNTTLTVNGSQFVSGMTVKLVLASDGTDISGHTALSYSLVSSTQITVTVPTATTSIAPGTIVQLEIVKSGLSVNSQNLTVSEDPNWTTNAGTVATIVDALGTNQTVATLAATAGAGGGTLNYASDDNTLDTTYFDLNLTSGVITTHASNALTGLTGSGNATESFNANAKISGDATKNTVRAFNIIVNKGATGGTGANGSGSPYTFTGDGTNGTSGVTYRVHEFWYSGSGAYYDHTFQVYYALTNVEFLVIAGGGSGGVYSAATPPGYINGNQGNSSVINYTGGTISTVGGGYGGAYSSRPGGAGGSGGGGGGHAGSGGSATANEGYAGQAAAGDGANPPPVYLPGGGGGAGGTSSSQGVGGDGLQSYITGSAVTRGGGGGASATSDSPYAWAGGSGGGGAGGAGNVNNNTSQGVQGTDGTGSGGGADDHNIGAGHGGGGAGGYRSAVYVGSTGETSGGGSSAQSKISFNVGSYTMRVGAGGASVGSSSDALSGRGGHGIIIIRYPI